MRCNLKRTFVTLFFAAALVCSCSDSRTSAEEETEINTMDSVSRAVEDSTKRLEEQTERVEEKLEQLDKEFNADNSKK